jgi:hypothetical protein
VRFRHQASWASIGYCGLLDKGRRGASHAGSDWICGKHLIFVQQKCRNHQNHSSMSAVLTALSSPEISDLRVHSGRRSNFEALLKHHDPAGSSEAYCNLLQATEGPCIPAFATFGRDLHNMRGETPDTFSSPTNPDATLISFSKHRRYCEIMLRHQRTAYNFAENDSTAVFINRHLHCRLLASQSWSGIGLDSRKYRNRKRTM